MAPAYTMTCTAARNSAPSSRKMPATCRKSASTQSMLWTGFLRVTAKSALATRRNPVHSMLWVLALFLHVAGIFLLLGAEFLAAVQVIVYAGAILIFYLFVLMLLDLPGEVTRPRFGRHWPLAAAAAAGFIGLIWFAQAEAL